MARPSKLTVSDARRIRRSHHKVPVAKLAKDNGVCESTIYKVFDGTYVAAPDPVKPKAALPKIDVDQMLTTNDFDELTLATVQFVLAKKHLEQVAARR